MNELKNLATLPVLEKTTKANRVRKGKLVKRLSAADRRIAESTLRKHRDTVVTGCRHTAGLIGVSATTGHKRIKQWIEAGILKVHDVVFFTPAHSPLHTHAIVDAYRASGGRGISVYSKKEGGVKHIIGKQVYEFNSVAYPTGLVGTDRAHGLKSAYSPSKNISL